MTQNEFLIC